MFLVLINTNLKIRNFCLQPYYTKWSLMTVFLLQRLSWQTWRDLLVVYNATRERII